MARGCKTGGRKKGTPNKLTAEIKDAVEKAFVAVGGSRYLEKIAAEHPAVFCTLLAKVLPRQMELSGPDGEPNRMIVEIRDPTRPRLDER